MKTQILTLIDSLRGSHDSFAFTKLFAACSVWTKLIEENRLDDEQTCNGNATIELLAQVMNDCGPGHLDTSDWKFSDAELVQLMYSLQAMVQVQAVSYKDLSEAINYMLEGGGKKYGNISIPPELCELGVGLLKDKTESVYCPFTAGYQFAQLLPSSSEKAGDTPVSSDAFFAEVQSELLDSEFIVVNSDPIQVPAFIGDGGLKQFESAIALPPFGVKYGKSELHDIWGRFPEKSLMGDVYQLRHMLAQTSDRVVCFVTHGFLFRSAAGEKHFKQDVIGKNWLEAIIALPENLLSGTSVPVSVVVFDKKKTKDTVLFVDASSENFADKTSRVRNRLAKVNEIVELANSVESSEFSRRCTVKEIEAMDYNLSPNRYVITEEEKGLQSFLQQFRTAKLADLVDIIRTQAVKHEEGAGEAFVEHNLTSLNSIGQLVGEGKLVNVSSKNLAKAQKQKIQKSDVLVSCRGAVGRIALVEDDVAENCIASQAFAILRVKPHIDALTSEALFQYLISEFGQLQLAGLVTGTTAQMLASKDLSNLQVPLFSQDKLAELKNVRTRVVETQKKIELLSQEIAEINASWLS